MPDEPPMSQGEIDQLLAGLLGDQPAAPTTPAAPAAVPGGAAPQAAAAERPEAVPPPVAVDPAELDRLLASLDAGSSSDAQAPAAAAVPAAAPAEGPLGQDDIDQILKRLDESGAAPVTAAAPAAPPPSPAPATGPVPPAAAAEPPPAPAAESPPPSAPGVSGVARKPAAELLAAKPGDASGTRGTASRATLALSTEDLSALVSKHAPAADKGPSEAMIDQNDIDALVKQLGAATGISEPPPTMSQELAKHDAAIDQLLGEGKPSANQALTMDAIDPRALGGDKPPSTSASHRGPATAYTVNVPVLTPPELRGARWLLAAAVLLLAVCAGTLVVVAGAVRTLGGELAHERQAGLEPSEDYGGDFAAAVARLNAPDGDQAATGVLFLQRLKKRYPSHATEVALTLARHFRAHGAWREAAREYALVVDDPQAVGDDPRALLEHAEALRNLKDRDGAKRQLYALLAEEGRWTGPADPPRPATVGERNARTLVEAHLLLARLLDEPGDGAVARLEGDAHGDAESAHGDAESAHAAEPAHAAEAHAAGADAEGAAAHGEHE